MKSKSLEEYINEYFIKKGENPWKCNIKDLSEHQIDKILKDIKKIID